LKDSNLTFSAASRNKIPPERGYFMMSYHRL
jgi:hypothetical protein